VNGNVFLLNDIAFCLMKNFMDEIDGISREDVNKSMEDKVIDIIQSEYDCDDRRRIYSDLKGVFRTIWEGDSEISEKIFSPFQADLALTYCCNNNCIFCYCGGPKSSKEISIKDWDIILNKLGEVGVFKINFTGGEPLLRLGDLEYLLDNYQNYFSTKLTTNGRLLSKDVCKSLKDKGLQCVQIAIEHDKEMIHDRICDSSGAWKDTVNGISNALDSGLLVSTITTLMKDNKDCAEDLIVFLSKLGVRNVSANSLFYSGRSLDSSRISEVELLNILNKMTVVAKANNSRINWLFPTCYKILNPIKLGVGVRRCSAVTGAITIEPDGNVIPCHCWFHESMGNILLDDWSIIWNSDVAMRIRNRSMPDKCFRCEWISQCSGACPLESANVKRC
jgi:radical SAM protein with 4Fe4S-binding SPASM domain